MGRVGRMAQSAALLGLATVCNYAFSFLTVFYAARVLRLAVLEEWRSLSQWCNFPRLTKSDVPLYDMRSMAAAQ